MSSTPLLNALNLGIETYLHADPLSSARLARLQGKAFSLTLTPLNITFYGLCTADDLILTNEAPNNLLAHIKGTPWQLAAMTLSRPNERHRFFADDIEISGDAEFAQQIMHLFDAVHIDWEEMVSQCVGDGPAFRLSQAFKVTRSWFTSSLQSFIHNVDDYIHDEKACAPHPFAVDDFLNDVDDVRMHTERLEARLNLLKANLTEGTPSENN